MKNNILPVVFGGFFMVAACSCSNADTVEENGGVTTPPSTENTDVKILTTTTSLSKDLTWSGADFGTGTNMSPNTITLNDATTYQSIDGFGAAITGATCYNLSLMQEADRKKFLQETFSLTNGYGFSYVRIAIGCSDFSLSEYTCCDTKGIENFALQSEEKNYIIPVLKEILAINPNLRVIAAPWTCPKWMKVKALGSQEPWDQWTSGQLNPAYYQDYATYFVKWVQAFQKEGIQIYALTPQNEPLNRGNSASLYMTWQEELDFVKTALGPAFQTNGIRTKILAYDHNYNYDNIAGQEAYPTNIYADAEAGQYIAGAAYHNYGGNRSELLNIHAANPEKELLFTETSIGTWNSGRDLNTRLMADMEEVALGTVNNWCKGAIVWNLMLDNDRGPNREGGCQTCYGAVDINVSDYKTIIRNSHYYIIAHMGAVVHPDAVRIASSGYRPDGLIYSAFKNSDGSYAIVLCNKGEKAQQITVADGQHYFRCTVPAKGVVSAKW